MYDKLRIIECLKYRRYWDLTRLGLNETLTLTKQHDRKFIETTIAIHEVTRELMDIRQERGK